MSLLILILAGYGLANILTFGKIFSGTRQLFVEFFDDSISSVVIAQLSYIFNFYDNEETKELLQEKFTEFCFCIMCIGFWSGIAIHFLMYLSPIGPPSNFFLDACMVSGSSWFLDSVLVSIEKEE